MLEYRKRLDDLIKYKVMTSEEIFKQAEIVMIREHMCNINLKIDTEQKKDHYLVW